MTRGGRRTPGAPAADDASTADRIHALETQVAELAAEVQECRALNLRLAELIDIVQELLLPVSMQDKEKVAELMERYTRSVG